MDENGTGGNRGNTSLLPYDRWVEEALRDVVRRTLHYVLKNGLPGEHHCYITFRTKFAGAHVPGHLRAQHPETMTIVLQHQFDGLAVEDDHFEVTLRFGGKPEHLVVPFAAITAFHDPAVNFGLQLNVHELAEAITDKDKAAKNMVSDAPSDSDPDTGTGDGTEQTGEVIALDQFRKK